MIESRHMFISQEKTAARHAEAASTYIAIGFDCSYPTTFKSTFKSASRDDDFYDGRQLRMESGHRILVDPSVPTLTRYVANSEFDVDASGGNRHVVLEMGLPPIGRRHERDSGYYGENEMAGNGSISAGSSGSIDSGIDSAHVSIGMEIGNYLATGELPGQGRMDKESGIFAMIESLRSEDANSLAGKPVHAEPSSRYSFQHYLTGPLKQVFANEHTDPALRRLSNVANVLLRTIATTGIAGISNALLTSQIERALVANSAGIAGRTALGVAAPLLPLAIGLATACRDIHRGDATYTSVNTLARLALTLASTASIVAASASGALPAMAAGLAATVITDAMRQVIQNYLVVTSDGPPEKSNALIASSLVAGAATLGTSYLGDYVDVAMAPGAWSGSSAATKIAAGTTVATADLFVAEKIKRFFADSDSQPEIRFKLEAKNPGLKQLWEEVSGPYCSRAMVSTGTSMMAAAAKKLAGRKYGPEMAELAENATAAIAGAVLYTPFSKAIGGKSGGEYTLGGEVLQTLPGTSGLDGRISRRLSVATEV